MFFVWSKVSVDRQMYFLIVNELTLYEFTGINARYH